MTLAVKMPGSGQQAIAEQSMILLQIIGKGF